MTDATETLTIDRRTFSAAVKLLQQALHLRQYGERAPGWKSRPNETWSEWDTSAVTFLHDLRRENHERYQ